MIRAQYLYDRRRALGEIDGQDLHDIFRAVCDDPSPTGSTPISPATLRTYADEMRASYAAHKASGTRSAEYLLDVATFCERFL